MGRPRRHRWRHLALQQIPRPGRRRRGAAHPPSQRLQDRQPDHLGSDRRRRADGGCSKATVTARSSSRAMTPSTSTSSWPAALRSSLRRDRRHTVAARRRNASGRPAWPMIVLRTPKGWTGPKDGRRTAGRGHVPVPPGARGRGPHEPRAPGRARSLDAELPGRGALRRGGAPPRRAGCACAVGHAPHERQPTRQRGAPAARTSTVPDFTDYAVPVERPGTAWVEPTRVLGRNAP